VTIYTYDPYVSTGVAPNSHALGQSTLPVFQTVQQYFSTITNQYMAGQLQNILTVLTGIIGTLVVIWIVIQAYKIMMGTSQRPIMELGLSCLKIGVIAYFALNAQHYADGVANLINGIDDSLTQAIMGQGSGSIGANLDKILVTAVHQMSFCQSQISLMHTSTWSWIIVILCLLIAYVPFLLEVAILVFGSQVIIVILTAIGSIFLCCLMFQSTKRFFDSWVSKLVEQIFTIMLAMVASNFMMVLFRNTIQSQVLSDTSNPFGISLFILIIGIICAWVLSKVNQLAGSLAGGFALGVLQLSDISDGLSQAGNAMNVAAKPVTVPASYLAGKAGEYLMDKWQNRGDHISGSSPTSGQVADAPNSNLKNDQSLKQTKEAIRKYQQDLDNNGE
jgi:type IV secretion system protein VirB6